LRNAPVFWSRQASSRGIPGEDLSNLLVCWIALGQSDESTVFPAFQLGKSAIQEPFSQPVIHAAVGELHGHCGGQGTPPRAYCFHVPATDPVPVEERPDQGFENR
jgi:hypothetical protein